MAVECACSLRARSRKGRIPGVNRRALLLAILVYVALDLSLPAMPGAFVFEPGDSVEGAQVARGRLAAEVVMLPTLNRSSFVLPSPHIDLRHRMPPINDIVRLARSDARCLPRAVCAAPPLSEDPH